MKIYAWLSDEENLEMNRRENPEIYEILDETLEKIKKEKEREKTNTKI